MPQTEEQGNARERDGWRNACPKCLRFYWIRAADLNAEHARRFKGRESNERHECEVPA